jgi:hypothetical protein
MRIQSLSLKRGNSFRDLSTLLAHVARLIT